MFEILLCIIIGVPLGIFIKGVFECSTNKDIAIKGTKNYKEKKRKNDEDTRKRLRDGPKSTKKELQQWWDDHH